MCHVSSTRLTHELVSLFALATALKLYFLTTEYLFEADIDTSVFAWHSTQSAAVSDSNDVYIIFNPFWVTVADQGVGIETIMKWQVELVPKL